MEGALSQKSPHNFLACVIIYFLFGANAPAWRAGVCQSVSPRPPSIIRGLHFVEVVTARISQMSTHQANNPLDLLRLNPQPAPPSPSENLHGAAEPRLDIDWRQFHQGLAGNFAELFRRVRFAERSALRKLFQGFLG